MYAACELIPARNKAPVMDPAAKPGKTVKSIRTADQDNHRFISQYSIAPVNRFAGWRENSVRILENWLHIPLILPTIDTTSFEATLMASDYLAQFRMTKGITAWQTSRY